MSAAITDADWKLLMGGDADGNCRGCGQPIKCIDPDCPVCMIALTAFVDDEPDFDALLAAARSVGVETQQ